MGTHGYHGLEERLKDKEIVVVNGHTNEVVDITGMSYRTLRFLLGRSTEDDNGRFVVKGAVMDIMNKAVYKFHIIL